MIHQPIDRPPLPAPLADLQQGLPGWSLWISTPEHGYRSHYYASRLQRTISRQQAAAGWAMTLHDDTPEGLADQLANQQRLAERRAA